MNLAKLKQQCFLLSAEVTRLMTQVDVLVSDKGSLLEASNILNERMLLSTSQKDTLERQNITLILKIKLIEEARERSAAELAVQCKLYYMYPTI